MRVDPITFEVVNNALVGVAEQMAATILRTSYSTVVREMLDYSTAVFDPNGHIIAQSCRIPIHLNSMSRSLRTTLDGIIPIEEWNEGDIIITNDPYLGGQHLPDVQTFMPVYADGKIVAICGTLDHHLDLGGMRPGSYAGDAVEIFQEGFRIPPFKLQEKGKPNERFLAVFDANVRQPDQTGGDLRAQAAALNIGRDGVLELVARYGVKTFESCLLDAIDTSETRMRTKIRELPEGDYYGEYYVDDDGVTDERITVKVKLTIEDGSIHLDFTGTDKQRRAPTNATISSCESASYFAILSILDPTIPSNFGLYKPITITAPEGTVVNAQSPAPVVGRNTITHTIVSAIMQALADVVPERVTAGYYANSNVHILAGDGTGEHAPWILFDIEVGGGGARRTKDGVDCWSQGIHNLANTPIEMIEVMYPLQFTRYEFLPDTGGAGRTRGGLGVRRDIKFLDRSGTLETQFDKFKVEPFALDGGKPGSTGKLWLNPDSNAPVSLKSKTNNQRLVRNDIFSMCTQGGGGYGPPPERCKDAIKRDIVEGKLTPERAKLDYGVEVSI
ncbi:hydantoinase B/oxoprolinase family protein [Leisingera daeponensis]|uniref:hydantoinase B/oxoprolinase family protein n=1 Tax=Leisingera daeponensis TaxID=405746 RepID=UPI001C973E87|nr:hydantoinase B/oxoprolinase family protein [Leisingera daeponensis]MBY6058770.1 hydantoinase B/oxoprolinase family protein [Leisingera daeponensis]